MTSNLANLWWIACGALIVAELLSGTFYLLMLSFGAAAAALAAHLQLGFAAQLLAAAVVGGATSGLWHWKRLQRLRALPPSMANPDMNLDIGQSVSVEHWAEDGSCQVIYRGTQWSARYAGEGSPTPGRHRIQALEGSCLLLTRA